MTRTFNHCIKEANGDFILFTGSDDILRPKIIEKEIKVMEKYKSVGLVHSAFNIINGEGKITSRSLSRKINKRRVYANSIKYEKDIVIGKMIERNLISMPSALIRKKCFTELGEFDENLKYQDYEMWFRILKKYDIYYLNKKLFSYRSHDKNYSTSSHHLTIKNKINEEIKVMNKIKFINREFELLKNSKLKMLHTKLMDIK
jgi:GT2 family glycosyltransferase